MRGLHRPLVIYRTIDPSSPFSVGFAPPVTGAPGKPELSFPSDGQDTASAFRYSRYVRAGVSRHAVWFRNGAFEYAVFADSNSESGRLERKYGVSVSAAGGVAPTRTLACRTGKVVNRMPDLEGLIPCQGQGADPALGCS